ncbi:MULTISPECIES: proline--tRNA ligase [Pyrobaculum]|uniref:Proline--tRNA ligase n=3 Tax=Pyrobaculum TaxID=2276 RepID=SYP_PYRAR|nr:proline--tRNA ligase [Pyrobaculum arsenaticum]A4WJ22.1 RecName: Full=Proline--tRNA ligase; AltName: Full=Prolyl-tRNA synthetase; Short=ProRS [Pyrobaculum arsenaticum DSM 13514]AFA39556.1 prolyl-tRNA synthetase, family I [Pyrobaculum oguniense TE7]ABP50389.1 prolyl-tRNA synthetase [Pyrobaculum arsenaticum DSM 13514]MCY0890377.1 proline--tRNA ligase [Pyrobaculum arsenaticum]NYR14667.1 proline--tRNA ligase [Pyrobaculum arsenaticum]
MELIREARPHGREKLRANLIEWFHWLLREAELYDVRYPVKGAYVWRPYGMRLRRHVEELIRRSHDETGHQEVLFPVFIPYEFFGKESQHIRGFEKEVFWVSKGGEEGERLVLRPTSETAIMPMVKLWVHDYKDLPLRLYQIVSVFRAETKMTHPMIRLREISMFKEAHTVHVDREDAERQVREAVEIYKKIFDEMCLAYMINKRPDWDKFAGAEYTIAFDTVLPDGRTLQIGTVHYLGTNFTRVFEVTYLAADGTRRLAHTTSYGISERSIAAMLITHGDDAGTVLPPRLAPIQVVIVPIFYGEEEAASVISYAREVEKALREAGMRVHIDDRPDKTPGWKFYFWELKGVPLRVEVGKRDLEKRQVVITRRDTLEKYAVGLGELVDAVRGLMRTVEENLRRRAWEELRSRIVRAETVEAAKAAIREGKVVEVPWSGDNDCGIKLKDLVGADALGVPLDSDASVGGFDLRDLACGEKRAEFWLRLSERY